MDTNINAILLRRKNKLLLDPGTAAKANDRYIATIMKNIADMCFGINEPLV